VKPLAFNKIWLATSVHVPVQNGELKRQFDLRFQGFFLNHLF